LQNQRKKSAVKQWLRIHISTATKSLDTIKLNTKMVARGNVYPYFSMVSIISESFELDLGDFILRYLISTSEILQSLSVTKTRIWIG
jgi:hypothetical protein